MNHATQPDDRLHLSTYGHKLTTTLKSGLIIILTVALLLNGCTEADPAVVVPTDYLISTHRHGISYLTDDHPEIMEVSSIVMQFLEIDQTQDYHNPSYDELKGLVSQNLLQERKRWQTQELQDYTIRKLLLDSEIANIIFTSDRERPTMAIATANFRVVYTHATEEYRERHQITLDEPLQLSVSLTLKYEDARLQPHTPLVLQANPYGWYIAQVSYYVQP